MRLIDADAINKYLKDNGLKRDIYIDTVLIVDSVVHGHWIYDPNGMDWNLGAWRCSKCGCKNKNIGGDERINPLLFAGSKYCPNCGAKMDEDTEREDVHD
jgi:hypothetical protein